MAAENTFEIKKGVKRRLEFEEDSDTERCPECDTASIVHDVDRRETICDQCGLVLNEESIDYGPEWRSFTHRDRMTKSRVGAPLTESMHDRGLTTTIDWRDRDSSGNTMSPERRGQFHRLRKWQERIRTRNAGERNLKYALSEIDRMVSALGLPFQVKETASLTYRRALDQDLIRGRSIEGVASSTLYVACRKEQIPRSLEEITNVSRVDQREIARTYRYIASELDINLLPIHPRLFLPRFCSELEVSSTVESKAVEIVEQTTDIGLHSGKSPPSFAAAAIYAASLLCDEPVRQRSVADTANSTVVTIRNRYRDQLEAIGEPASSTN